MERCEHFYKGPAGVMDSAYSGLVLGGVYLLSGRNPWASILAHGLCDTAAVVALFVGGQRNILRFALKLRLDRPIR